MSEHSIEPSCEPVQTAGLLDENVQQSSEREPAVSWSHFSLLSQLARFGVVGFTAATVHYSIVVALVQAFSYEPLIANIFAFLISFQISYFGHRRFTFSGTTTMHTIALPRLLLLQIFNFVANESLFYFLLSLNLPYQLALVIVLATLPLFTFTVSKLWVFRH